ncbi:MAG: hypothetical protein OIF47_03315 [Marinibacterium sp.]|nr:hypothetical protein [Marinibacterium sp.]
MTHRLWARITQAELLVLAAGTLYYIAFLIAPERFMDGDFGDDLMASGGFGLLLAGIVIARAIQSRFSSRVLGVVRSGAILLGDTGDDGRDRIEAWINQRAVLMLAIIFPTLLVLYLIGVASAPSDQTGKPHLIAGGTMGLFMISVRFAFGVATGLVAARLADPQNSFVLQPAHDDRASGFGSLGFFYLDQAAVLLLPALFMVTWILFVQSSISQFQEATVVSNLVEAITDTPQPAPELRRFATPYVTCTSARVAPEQCPRTDLAFFWQAQFVGLSICNLVIFFFCWIVPMLILARRMRGYRRQVIDPRIRTLEQKLFKIRTQFRTPSPDDLDALERQTDEMAQQLAVYRACPAFPIPLWTAVTAAVSNLSAVLGILGTSLL